MTRIRVVQRLLVAIVALLCLSGSTWQTLLSPGRLVEAHRAIEGQCDKCHAVFSGVPDERCLSCHTAIVEREAAGRGYHASVAEQDCVSCHVDHTGPKGPSTKEEVSFDHAETGFALGGRHSRLACEKCHLGPLETMVPSCGECHDDPHQSTLGPDCGVCHNDQGWQTQLKSLATHQTDMTGGHATLGCDDCHLYGENLELFVPCANCHKQGHGGTTAACSDCHQVSGFKPAEFDHGPCGCSFPGKHQTVGCLACHEDFNFTNTPTLCSGCHEGDRPHEPLGECSQCHTALSWSDGRFDHRQAKFALDGAHLAVSCSQCHPDTFRGVPTACTGCHAEAGMEAHGDFGACEPCHTTAGFTPSSFDHASVSFPLSGRHSTEPCQSCHAAQVEGYERRSNAKR